MGLAPRKASHPVAKAPVARISSGGATKTLELLFGAGGIYAAFLYYGSLQEDVFRYASEEGDKFTQVWFLQVLEALCNVVVGFQGLHERRFSERPVLPGRHARQVGQDGAGYGRKS